MSTEKSTSRCFFKGVSSCKPLGSQSLGGVFLARALLQLRSARKVAPEPRKPFIGSPPEMIDYYLQDFDRLYADERTADLRREGLPGKKAERLARISKMLNDGWLLSAAHNQRMRINRRLLAQRFFRVYHP